MEYLFMRKQDFLEAVICQAAVDCLFTTCFTLRTKCTKIVPLEVQQIVTVAVHFQKAQNVPFRY